MKTFRRILITVATLILACIAFLTWYNHSESAIPTHDKIKTKSPYNRYFTMYCIFGVKYIVYHSYDAGAMTVMYKPDGTIATCEETKK